jgi:hypothetical protein
MNDSVSFKKVVLMSGDAEGKHGWRVGGVQVHSGGKRVVVTVSRLSREGLALT